MVANELQVLRTSKLIDNFNIAKNSFKFGGFIQNPFESIETGTPINIQKHFY